MLDLKNPRLYRPALSEAITALESLVERTVFPALSLRFEKELVDWLKEKSKNAFDARFSLPVPLATGIQIENKGVQWARYKRARSARHEVVHQGRKVSQQEAEEVVSVISTWMNLILSTVNLELQLSKLKTWVEGQSELRITSSNEANDLVERFFKNTTKATAEAQKPFKMGDFFHRPDLILTFGKEKIVVETKFIKSKNIDQVVAGTSGQIEMYKRATGIERACFVVFTTAPSTTAAKGVRKDPQGNMFIVINVSPT